MDEVRTSDTMSLLLTRDGVRLRDHLARRELGLPADQVPALAQVLAIGTDWTPVDKWLSLVAEAGGMPASDAVGMLDSLTEAGVMLRRQPATTRADRRGGDFADSSGWDPYRWSAAFAFHRAVRAIPPPDWGTVEGALHDAALMERLVAAETPPPHWLDRAGGRRVALPAPEPGLRGGGPIRDTVVTGAGPQLSIDGLGRLLRLAFGQTGTRRLPVTGEHPRRTVPSGGSRHPTEAYILVFDVAGVPPGSYHYSVPNHALDEIRGGDPSDFFTADVLILNGRMAFRPRVAVVLASVVERSMFRYRDSRSYRVLYLDAGHLLQNLAYLASTAGRPSYRGYLLRVSAVAQHLDLNPLLQVPVAFGAIG